MTNEIFPAISSFPGSTVVKNLPANARDAGDTGSIPGLERSPGVRNGNPFQYSCLENPHGQKSLAGYSPWGRKELETAEQAHTASVNKELSQLSVIAALQPELVCPEETQKGKEYLPSNSHQTVATPCGEPCGNSGYENTRYWP